MSVCQHDGRTFTYKSTNKLKDMNNTRRKKSVDELKSLVFDPWMSHRRACLYWCIDRLSEPFQQDYVEAFKDRWFHYRALCLPWLAVKAATLQLEIPLHQQVASYRWCLQTRVTLISLCLFYLQQNVNLSVSQFSRSVTPFTCRRRQGSPYTCLSVCLLSQSSPGLLEALWSCVTLRWDSLFVVAIWGPI